jgi:hypothetical protein
LKHRSFVGLRRLRRVEPSDTSRRRLNMSRGSLDPTRQRPSRVNPFPPEHVNAPAFPSSRCLPPERTCANALSSAHEERCLRWPAGAVAARVHRRWKTSTRPLSARYSRTSSRPRAPLRFLQVDVSTSTTGTARTSRTTEGGRDDCHVGREEQPFRVASPSPATAEGTQGQGSRTPSLDTPHRDCSRRRLRPNPDRFGHLLSRVPLSSRSGVTWGESDAANATPLARQTQREGRAAPDFREEIGRSPTRGAFRRWPFAERTGRCLSEQTSCSATASSAFFTTQDACEGRSHESRWLGPTTRENGEPLCSRGPQRPLTTSAFE